MAAQFLLRSLTTRPAEIAYFAPSLAPQKKFATSQDHL
jgi:hypothetical protein